MNLTEYSYSISYTTDDIIYVTICRLVDNMIKVIPCPGKSLIGITQGMASMTDGSFSEGFFPKIKKKK